MVKTYLRYSLNNTFGIICPYSSNCLYDSKDKIAVSGGVSDVLFWNVRTGNMMKIFKSENTVTYVTRSPKSDILAVGYDNGSIQLFNINTSESVVTFKGHHGAITCLTFDSSGVSLISGSTDNTIVIWDLVSETGVCRLKGHNNAITGIKYINGDKRLVSISKDGLMKLWDIDTQSCIQTIVGHRGEIWCLAIYNNIIVTASKESLIRVWKYKSEKEESNPIEEDGYLTRENGNKVDNLQFSSNGRILICQCSGKVVEIYKILNEKELEKRLHRKEKRLREKQRKERRESIDLSMDVERRNSIDITNKKSENGKDKSKENNNNNDDENNNNINNLQKVEYIMNYTVLHTNYKIKTCCLSDSMIKNSNSDDECELLVCYMNNSMTVFNIKLCDDKELATSQIYNLSIPGHSSDIRSLSISSDDQTLLSTCNNYIKIWSIRTFECIRTMECDYPLCSSFLPGNNYCIVGTKSGHIVLYDINTGDIVQDIVGHDGSIWSIDIRPDHKGIMTGGADHNFDLVQVEGSLKKQINIVHTRTLEMSHDVLCVKYSHHTNSKELLILVSLLDNTVKVFYEDSLKFVISLYGHKLPVLNLSVSSDNLLVVTASADKNIKIWGLAFGDCHKSIFAHADSITNVSFVNNTHYFFSCSKDGIMKYWNADNFELILTLPSHVGEIWSLCVSHLGDYVVTCGHDKSIRYWTRTDEMVFPDEEREIEEEKKLEKELENENNHGLVNETVGDADTAASKTSESVKSAERLIDGLDLVKKEKAKYEAYLEDLKEAEDALSDEEKKKREMLKRKGEVLPPLLNPPKGNIKLMGLSCEKYILKILKSIPSSELESCFLILPFTLVETLFEYFKYYIENNSDEVELVSRSIYLLLKIHYKTIVVSKELQPILLYLKEHIRDSLLQIKKDIGFDMVYTKNMKRKYEDRMTKSFDQPEKKVRI